MAINSYYVVRFAVRGEEPKVLLISEDEHDRWCECEPPEGYLVFDTLHSFEIYDVTDECLDNLHEINEISRLERL